MSYYLMILVGAVLVNNFVLSRFLGCCPFLGVSKKTETALGMSGAVIFVMTVAAAVTWCLDHWLLQPHGLGYIHTLAFILVIAALVGVAQHGLAFPVTVRTVKGFELVIDGAFDGKAFRSVSLTGPVARVFDGEIDLDSLDFRPE